MENVAVWIALGAAFVALVPVVVIASRKGANSKREDDAHARKRDDGGSATYTSSGAGNDRKPVHADGPGLDAADGGGDGSSGGGD